MYSITHCTSPLGPMLLASDGVQLTGAWFEGQKHYASALPGVYQEDSLPIFDDALQWLELYFSGCEPGFTVPVSFHGTAFQCQVWELLRRIPYGQTVTYGQLARQLAAQRGLASLSAQAVGGAVGRNPISIFVPCHRVVGAKGSLTGYAGGLHRKAALLALEAQGSPCHRIAGKK